MHVENFSDDEWRGWDVSPRLKVLLDVLRFQLGAAIQISGSSQALGRRTGKSQSEHNVELWGQVLAADVFIDGIHTCQEADMVVTLATRLGFTGIGVYSDTTNNQGQRQVMFHLGVRPTRKMGDPATWGRVHGKPKQDGTPTSRYTSITEAIESLET